MKLLTQELEEKFKKFPLRSQEEKLGNAELIAKFYNPTGVGTWYITEGQILENGDVEMFGYCHLGDDEMAEFGSVMLSELENLQLPMGMTIERDLYIKDGTNLVQALRRDGMKVPEFIEENYIEKTYENVCLPMFTFIHPLFCRLRQIGHFGKSLTVVGVMNVYFIFQQTRFAHFIWSNLHLWHLS